METTLKRAFDRIAALPDDEQKRFGDLLLSWLDDDAAWENSFASNPEALDALAAEARADIAAGRSLPLEFPPKR
jgi:hypothetical protein